jgi:hypothetical protein
LRALGGFTRESSNFNFLKFYDTVFRSVNREIAADVSARTSDFGRADLAD